MFWMFIFSDRKCIVLWANEILREETTPRFKLISRQICKSADLWQNMEKLDLILYKEFSEMKQLQWFNELLKTLSTISCDLENLLHTMVHNLGMCGFIFLPSKLYMDGVRTPQELKKRKTLAGNLCIEFP